MDADGTNVGLVVALIYGIYFVGAAFIIRSVWRKTKSSSDDRRLILRSLAAAVLFAPVIAGMRIAPFLLALIALVILDLMFVRPLSLAWVEQSLGIVAYQMLLPFSITWGVLFTGALMIRRLRTSENKT